MTTYAYEADSALDALTHNLAGTTNDVSYTFDYNLANQLTLKSVSNAVYTRAPVAATADYAVNGLNQYTQVTDTSAPSGPAEITVNNVQTGTTEVVVEIGQGVRVLSNSGFLAKLCRAFSNRREPGCLRSHFQGLA